MNKTRRNANRHHRRIKSIHGGSDSERQSSDSMRPPKPEKKSLTLSATRGRMKSRKIALVRMRRLALPNGKVYEGEYMDGKPHGRGIMKWRDGRAYEGEFKDGKLHGRGTLKLSDGRVYEGEFKNGKLHGRGIMKWRDGREYEGEWKEGKMHGHGKLVTDNGLKTFEGTFVDNRRDRGTTTWQPQLFYDPGQMNDWGPPVSHSGRYVDDVTALMMSSQDTNSPYSSDTSD